MEIQNEFELIQEEIDLQIKKHQECITQLEYHKRRNEDYLESAKFRKEGEALKFSNMVKENMKND